MACLLISKVPPAHPLLHPTAITANSVRLQWKQGDNGGAPIQGFVLNYRPANGEWEEITLNKKLSTHVVEGLNCGRSYEFYLIGE
ncbi:Down syndrome cell adhesion molecule-like protein Dscam2 [Orchesella cincta]|uniref:Down syndrome cell adhesion molecule-like protein Dscam2 n=1 Tax=Orchesella cincta TaxID=48709 RepID=A0A1D2N9W0_ORCCI|nr:Down syndrome cell adhesion molecule-like protein Dscam2 [Orchesella cincta]